MLKIMNMAHRTSYRRQYGTAVVEFALVAMLFFTLLFGILEFGRLFYLYNTVQEVTRRAAREAVVRWVDEMDDAAEIESLVLFGGTSLPAGAEITAANINIEYLTASGGIPTPFPGSAAENISACLSVPDGCIAFVRVSIVGLPGASCPAPNTDRACYTPMTGLFPFLSVPIPASTVTMPAESLGYNL